MHAQLSAIVDDLHAAEQRFDRLRRRLPADVWSRRPAPAEWSPVECLAHLNLTSRAMLPLLHAGLREAAAGPNLAAPRYRRDVVGWVVWRLMAPANGLRTRTRHGFTPSGDEPLATVLAEFTQLQSEIIACVDAADGRPIDRVTLRSPFDGRVRCNLYAALTLIPRHQHRHAMQAERAAGLPLLERSALAV